MSEKKSDLICERKADGHTMASPKDVELMPPVGVSGTRKTKSVSGRDLSVWALISRGPSEHENTWDVLLLAKQSSTFAACCHTRFRA